MQQVILTTEMIDSVIEDEIYNLIKDINQQLVPYIDKVQLKKDMFCRRIQIILNTDKYKGFQYVGEDSSDSIILEKE